MPRSASASLPRLLPATDQQTRGLGRHLRWYGAIPYQYSAGGLIGMLEVSGLTGRGGAAFPAARKLAATVGRGRRRAVVVANGAESEPASQKDRTLLWVNPHLVLDGLQLVAAAVAASEAHVYVHRHPRLEQRLRDAIAERAGAGSDRVKTTLVSAPPRFLSGEESALVSRINDQPARPRFKLPPVYERGIGDAPTLVQNVETLAHIALVARYGGDWFRSVGTADEPGSMLVTVRRGDGSVSVREIAIGTPLAQLLPASATRPAAVLVGGYHGAWLDAHRIAGTRLANSDLRPLGAMVGAGVVIELPADRCGLVESARVARYLALESAGQCGPCFNGLPRIANALTAIAEPRAHPAAAADLARWCGLVERRGACHHPDGTVRFIRSALTVFADEQRLHAAGRCSAADAAPFLPVPSAPPTSQQDWM